jgi:hypothetical protein
MTLYSCQITLGTSKTLSCHYVSLALVHVTLIAPNIIHYRVLFIAFQVDMYRVGLITASMRYSRRVLIEHACHDHIKPCSWLLVVSTHIHTCSSYICNTPTQIFGVPILDITQQQTHLAGKPRLVSRFFLLNRSSARLMQDRDATQLILETASLQLRAS